MNWQALTRSVGKKNGIKMILAAAIALILINIFSPRKAQDPDAPFTMQTCLQSIPDVVDGLEIVEGSRSKGMIITDMVPIVCRAKAIFEKMRSEGAPLESGRMMFRVAVEYNGEVISVRIQESDITYRPFRNKIIDLIAEKDFMATRREDTDTIFFYPIHFSRGN